MTMEMILQIMSNFGFPVLCCFVLGWYVNKTTENNRNDIKEIQSSYLKEISEMKDALNKNTYVIEKLCNKLGETND